MSISIQRHGRQVRVQVETLLGVDAQGRPTYNDAVLISARAVWSDVVIKAVNGSDVQTSLTLWVDGGEAMLPTTDARVTMETGWVGIVVEKVEGRGLQTGALDHVRVRLREQ